MPTQAQPVDRLSAAVITPSEMRSAEWARVDQWTRERAFYMAGVTRYETLQEMRDLVAGVAQGEIGEYDALKLWETHLDAIGYEPEEGQAGTIKDLRSLRRFNVALRTNRQIMNGWAQRENGKRPGPLQASPAFELVRYRQATVPRDWEARFVQAGGTIYAGRMIAPKLSDVWPALGNRKLFDDALGVDHPPFAYGSGKGWRVVGAGVCIDLGVMTAAEIRAQAETAVPTIASPGESLELRPRVTDEDIRASLTDEVEGLAEWGGDDGKTLVFTDPNGSRPMAAGDLQRAYATPLPPRFRSEAHPQGLFQRDAVLAFGEDPEAFAKRPERDAWDDLTRAVGRLADEADRRRVMRRVADLDDTTWIPALRALPLYKEALKLDTLAGRAIWIARAVLNLFL